VSQVKERDAASSGEGGREVAGIVRGMKSVLVRAGGRVEEREREGAGASA